MHLRTDSNMCCTCICVRACVFVRLSAKMAHLLVFSVEMPHLWICSRILCCVLVCMCVYVCVCVCVAER